MVAQVKKADRENFLRSYVLNSIKTGEVDWDNVLQFGTSSWGFTVPGEVSSEFLHANKDYYVEMRLVVKNSEDAGTREPFDLLQAVDDWQAEVAKRQKKKEEAAATKAKKIADQQAKRAAKEAAKATKAESEDES